MLRQIIRDEVPDLIFITNFTLLPDGHPKSGRDGIIADKIFDALFVRVTRSDKSYILWVSADHDVASFLLAHDSRGLTPDIKPDPDPSANGHVRQCMLRVVIGQFVFGDRGPVHV